MDNLERVKRNAGLIKESDTAPIVSSYKTDLEARNWIVTPDQAATIRNSLDILVPTTFYGWYVEPRGSQNTSSSY